MSSLTARPVILHGTSLHRHRAIRQVILYWARVDSLSSGKHRTPSNYIVTKEASVESEHEGGVLNVNMLMEKEWYQGRKDALIIVLVVKILNINQPSK